LKYEIAVGLFIGLVVGWTARPFLNSEKSRKAASIEIAEETMMPAAGVLAKASSEVNHSEDYASKNDVELLRQVTSAKCEDPQPQNGMELPTEADDERLLAPVTSLKPGDVFDTLAVSQDERLLIETMPDEYFLESLEL